MDYFINQDVRDTQRFGFGRQYGQRVILSPEEQLGEAAFYCAELRALPSSMDYFAQMDKFNQQKKAVRNDVVKAKQLRLSVKQYCQESCRQQTLARHQQVILTPLDFQERLIHFWGNHFSISGQKRSVLPMCAAIENEVVRHHWDGNFSEMLLAAIQHPAMLLYLDNQRSIGPNSPLGKSKRRGFNENLAREILELHTVGVNGSYQQHDVEELAKALTGWRVSYSKTNPGYRFSPQAHEPGTVTVMGKHYPQSGEQQAREILADLAMKPETARFLTTKLAQHFLGTDDPKVIETLSETYLANNGDLRPVYKKLIHLPHAQTPGKCRYRSPQQWCYAIFRSSGLDLPANALSRILSSMGEAPYKASSPAGHPDIDAPYQSPIGLRQRWMVANQLAHHLVKSLPREQRLERAEKLGEFLYGDDLDQHYQMVANKTENPATKVALLWLSPQFQYR